MVKKILNDYATGGFSRQAQLRGGSYDETGISSSDDSMMTAVVHQSVQY
jgi:hypothetical protein